MEKEELATNLLKWFETHRRSFPWRNGKFNRFQLLLTEILLQRTKYVGFFTLDYSIPAKPYVV